MTRPAVSEMSALQLQLARVESKLKHAHGIALLALSDRPGDPYLRNPIGELRAAMREIERLLAELVEAPVVLPVVVDAPVAAAPVLPTVILTDEVKP